MIRDQILAARNALGPAEVEQLSSQTVSRFLQSCGLLPRHWFGRTVAVYRPLPTELDLRELEKQLRSWGARLCFPRVVDRRAGLMEFATDAGLPSATWPVGPYGISEPPEHFQVVSPHEVDVIFVPGVVFGCKGERIGMGAGFYDRYLARATKSLRVALAFDFQVLLELEQKPWDQRVDWIWTERREIRLRDWHPG